MGQSSTGLLSTQSSPKMMHSNWSLGKRRRISCIGLALVFLSRAQTPTRINAYSFWSSSSSLLFSSSDSSSRPCSWAAAAASFRLRCCCAAAAAAAPSDVAAASVEDPDALPSGSATRVASVPSKFCNSDVALVVFGKPEDEDVSAACEVDLGEEEEERGPGEEATEEEGPSAALCPVEDVGVASADTAALPPELFSLFLSRLSFLSFLDFRSDTEYGLHSAEYRCRKLDRSWHSSGSLLALRPSSRTHSMICGNVRRPTLDSESSAINQVITRCSRRPSEKYPMDAISPGTRERGTSLDEDDDDEDDDDDDDEDEDSRIELRLPRGESGFEGMAAAPPPPWPSEDSTESIRIDPGTTSVAAATTTAVAVFSAASLLWLVVRIRPGLVAMRRLCDAPEPGTRTLVPNCSTKPNASAIHQFDPWLVNPRSMVTVWCAEIRESDVRESATASNAQAILAERVPLARAATVHMNSGPDTRPVPCRSNV